MRLPYAPFPPGIVSELPVRIDHPLLARDLTFITTTQCNIECSYCYNFYREKHMKLSPELAVAFLEAYLEFQDEEHNPRYLQVTFTGGEPTLNSDPIFAVVDHLNNKSIDCIPVLLTNGIIPTQLLQRFIDEKFLFQLSYDGGLNTLRRTRSNKSTHHHIVSTFEKLSKANAPIILRPTITQHNVQYMPEIIEFAKEHSVCGIIFDTCDHIGNALKNQVNRASPDDYVHYLFEAIAIARESNLDILIPEVMRYCNNGNYQQLPKICLLPDGTLTTTTKYLSQNVQGIEKAVIGKFSLANGLVFFQDRLQRMVDNVLQNLGIHCKSCEVYTYCRGRNPNLQLFREEIPMQKDEYRCSITRKIYQQIAADPFYQHSNLTGV